MNGRISIDGDIIPGGVELHYHGEANNPDALVNISFRIHNNQAVKKILLQALEYVENCIEAGEPEEKHFFVLNGGKN